MVLAALNNYLMIITLTFAFVVASLVIALALVKLYSLLKEVKIVQFLIPCIVATLVCIPFFKLADTDIKEKNKDYAERIHIQERIAYLNEKSTNHLQETSGNISRRISKLDSLNFKLQMLASRLKYVYNAEKVNWFDYIYYGTTIFFIFALVFVPLFAATTSVKTSPLKQKAQLN